MAITQQTPRRVDPDRFSLGGWGCGCHRGPRPTRRLRPRRDDEEELPAEPLIAAWAKVNHEEGLLGAARRWATAAASPIYAAETAARAEADATRVAFDRADPVQIIGADSISALIEAHTAAASAGVRVTEHQAEAVTSMSPLIEDLTLAPPDVGLDL